MARALLTAVSAVLMLLCASCVTNRSTKYLQNIREDFGKATHEEYRLQPKDEIVFQVFTTNEEAATMFNTAGGASQSGGAMQFSGRKIYDDGTIDLPYIDHVKIAGMTVREAGKYLTEVLRPYISNDLFVKVELSKKVYYTIGATGVGEHGMYKDEMNLFEALAQSGDLTLEADRKKIKILRNTNGQDTIIEFDIRSKDIVDSELYYIQPGDVIFANKPKGSFFKITSFSTFLSVIISSISFILLVINYTNS
ncbi:MAG: polysaccharide biosynthesis/export family protein [Paludibacteraceae bacterium]|nr:polysaccharide biosynthesis/export family protein [Paludibacteraceae bacterium]